MSDTTPASPATKAPRARIRRQKVPDFARYEGTSAWRKYRRRVRAYALFQAAQKRGKTSAATTSTA